MQLSKKTVGTYLHLPIFANSISAFLTFEKLGDFLHPETESAYHSYEFDKKSTSVCLELTHDEIGRAHV